MPDQNVREIQLGGKQLVFLFMASVVLAVAIFLLGISVGRGVGSADPDAPTESAASSPAAPAEMPPPTELTPEDTDYHAKLQDQPTPKALPEPAGSKPKPAASETTSVAVTPPPTPASTPAAAPPAAAPPAAVATAKPEAPAARGQAASGGWFVQVAAFKSRANADRQVADLKAKGFSAMVQADPGSLFRVRIGPFPDRAAAAQTADRLQRESNIRASVGR